MLGLYLFSSWVIMYRGWWLLPSPSPATGTRVYRLLEKSLVGLLQEGVTAGGAGGGGAGGGGGGGVVVRVGLGLSLGPRRSVVW